MGIGLSISMKQTLILFCLAILFQRQGIKCSSDSEPLENSDDDLAMPAIDSTDKKTVPISRSDSPDVNPKLSGDINGDLRYINEFLSAPKSFNSENDVQSLFKRRWKREDRLSTIVQKNETTSNQTR